MLPIFILKIIIKTRLQSNVTPTFKKLKTYNDHPWWWECVLGAGTGRIRLLTYRVPPGGDKYHTQDRT